MNFKENLPLIAGIAIPLFTIVLITSVIYIPHFFIHPKVNFVYTLGNWNTETFIVREGKAVKNSLANPAAQVKNNKKEKSEIPSLPKIYIHDVAKNTCKEITLEDLKKLTLSEKPTSSDGFSVTQDDQSGAPGGLLSAIIVGGSFDRCRNIYLKKDTYSRQIKTEKNDCWRGFNFVGWIEESSISTPLTH